jgi:AraC family transcriptional regulator
MLDMIARELTELPKGCYVGQKVKEFTFGDIITSETVFPVGSSSDWHYHAHPHFSHILSGGSKENRKSNSQVQSPGTGLYYYPGVPHQNQYYHQGTRIFNVEIDSAFFKTHELAFPSESLMHQDGIPLNAAGLMKILTEHYLNDDASAISITQLCINLISADPKVESNHPEWTKNIRAILNEHWNTPVTLQQIATLAEIHPVTLSKYFTRYFKCTFGEYLRRIKIERALTMIRANKNSLTEIAYECGFFDQAHFTKTFINVTGLLPKHYQKV